jgi:hypothetical protein
MDNGLRSALKQPDTYPTMPYFQRKPIEGLIDIVRSQAPIPGLPSRGLAPTLGMAGTLPMNPPAAITGIVEQAAAVLASERPSSRASAGPGPGSVALAQGTQIAQLREQANALIEQLLSLTGGRPDPATAVSPSADLSVPQPPSDGPELTVEPAPVLSAPGPVAPGAIAQIRISLINEDEQPVQIGFSNTDLIGEDGEHIPAEGVSFQPRELTLQTGSTGDVVVHVVIPAQTRCGVYSGLIRASKLDYLHAVLAVQVQ